MTERHFFLAPNIYLVRIRSYGEKREWDVYQEGLPNGPWLARGTTVGSLAQAKREAQRKLNVTLQHVAENPLMMGSTEKKLLIGTIVLGGLAWFVSTIPKAGQS